jgi:hypothetical protein
MDGVAGIVITVLGSLVQLAVLGGIIFLLVRRFGNGGAGGNVSNVGKVNNKNLYDWQRYEALDKIKSEKQLARIAMRSSHISLAPTVTEKVSDPRLLERLARGANDPQVRIAAFEKGFDQLIGDRELSYQVVAAMPKGPGAAFWPSFNPELLLRVAGCYPDIIRQFWKSIEVACHADDSRHEDKTTSQSNDCAHTDHKDVHSHADLHDPNNHLQRFPPAARL